MFGNDEPLVDQVKAAAADADEPVWQTAAGTQYRKLLDSDVADMKNVGGPYGGAIIAALFLERVRRRHAVGAPRHRRPDELRRRRRLAVARAPPASALAC